MEYVYIVIGFAAIAFWTSMWIEYKERTYQKSYENMLMSYENECKAYERVCESLKKMD